jgi:hypothetical protein
MVLITVPAWTEVPEVINYQGKLTDSGGNPLDGTYSMTFYLYDAETGGSDLWHETQSVDVVAGIYNVKLGAITPLDVSLFTNEHIYSLYLEVMVEGETLSPRQRLTSTAFAMKAGDADTLEGLASSEFAGISHDHSFGEITGTATDAQIPNNITINYAATSGNAANADSADFATNAANADMVDGHHAGDFAEDIHQHSGADITSGTVADARIAGSIARDSEIMPTVLAGDGPGSNLNADLLDGLNSSSFVHTSGGSTIYAASDSPLLTIINDNGLDGYGLKIDTDVFGLFATGGLIGISGHSVGGWAIHAESVNGDGVYVDAGDNGVVVQHPGSNGIYVNNAGVNGVYVTQPNNVGVYVASPGDYGVYLVNSGASGVFVTQAGTDGVYVNQPGDNGVEVLDATNWGVWASGDAGGGYFKDPDSDTYCFIASGGNGILCNKAKNFVEEHPTEPDQFIVYAALEGGEAGTYYRGTAQLTNGTATIDLPEHFSLVTEEEGLTVQVTPRADCKGIYVAEVTTTSIVVRELQGGTSKARFDFFINGIRSDYADYKVIRSKAELGLDKIEEAERAHEREAELEAERAEHQAKWERERKLKEDKRQRRELERKQRLEELSGKANKTG